MGPPQYPGTIGRIIEKVRAEVNTFIRSPVLIDEFCKASRDTGPKLVLNVKTRWNSTLRMLRNFANQEHALRRYYVTRHCAFPLSAWEMQAMKEVMTALSHVEKACLRLSSSNATLRKANLALEVKYKVSNFEVKDCISLLSL